MLLLINTKIFSNMLRYLDNSWKFEFKIIWRFKHGVWIQERILLNLTWSQVSQQTHCPCFLSDAALTEPQSLSQLKHAGRWKHTKLRHFTALRPSSVITCNSQRLAFFQLRTDFKNFRLKKVLCMTLTFHGNRNGSPLGKAWFLHIFSPCLFMT